MNKFATRLARGFAVVIVVASLVGVGVWIGTGDFATGFSVLGWSGNAALWLIGAITVFAGFPVYSEYAEPTNKSTKEQTDNAA